MSLQLSFTKDLDTYPEAYAKITQQSSNNAGENTNVYYIVEVWKSLVHKEAEVDPIHRDRFEVLLTDLVTSDFAGLYAHLKQQERYKTSIDV